MASIPRRTTVYVASALLAGTSILQSQGKPEVAPSTSERELDALAVAKVGPWSISGYEFRMSYGFGPAFAKRVSDSRKRYLTYMVYEKLLALDGQARGLGQWKDLKSQVSEIAADIATREMYKDDVLKRVHISDEELSRGVKQEQTMLSLEWLYLKSAGAVDEAVSAMRSGVPFDTLFARQVEQGAPREDRSMEVSRFRIGTRNPLFAMVVDSLSPGAPSLPIHGPDGWYIVRIEDRWRNAIVTQSDEQKMAEDVRRALTQQKGDALSDSYVREVMEKSRSTILRGPFNAVEAYVGTVYLPKEKYVAWKLRDRRGANELGDSSDLEPMAGDTLVTTMNGRFTVGDFLEWFRMRRAYITPDQTTPEAFFGAVEQLVWRMVRDRLLTQRAYARGYQNRAGVRRETQWWKEKMLYIADKNRIGDTIADSLPALRQYYEDHERSFRDDKGNVRPFESAKEDVWREYYNAELTKRLLHAILALKQKYPVTVDEHTLGRIPVDDENDPKAIDVYAVQKGGIYPHTAFPSIDYDWQTWE